MYCNYHHLYEFRQLPRNNDFRALVGGLIKKDMNVTHFDKKKFSFLFPLTMIAGLNRKRKNAGKQF